MGAWTRPTPSGGLEEVGPARCPNGHPLRYPNVMITSNVRFISYGCRTCDVWINRLHDDLVEWTSVRGPAPF